MFERSREPGLINCIISFPLRYSFMKTARIFTAVLIGGFMIFLFSGARIASARHFRQAEWFLDHKINSAGFFSADTLHFITPYPMWEIVVGNEGDSLREQEYPNIHFGDFYKNEFRFELSRRKTYYGKFSIKDHYHLLCLDFYKEDPDNPGDDLGSWIKDFTKNYSIIQFSRESFTLVRIKK